jgi:hypothetical protein
MRKIQLMLKEAGLIEINDLISKQLIEAEPNTLIPFKLPEGRTMLSFRSSVQAKCNKVLKDSFIVSSSVVGDTLYVLKEPKRSK